MPQAPLRTRLRSKYAEHQAIRHEKGLSIPRQPVSIAQITCLLSIAMVEGQEIPYWFKDIVYRVSPPVAGDALNALFAASWPGHRSRDFGPILNRSLAFVCAYHAECLIGFVNLAWDGGIHAFLLDTTVHPDWRRRGIGLQLVRQAAATARDRGIEWLHVDFEPHLEDFYRQCGFRATKAGLMHLDQKGGK